MAIKILTSRHEVAPYIENVQIAADQERRSFGFLPASAYEQFALQGRLVVAIDDKRDQFLGYVAYGGVPPQARIFQTYVSPVARGAGVGDLLIRAVINKAETSGFLSIRAAIADDLEAAKEFYRRNGFRPVLTRAGGATTKRKVVIHVRELATPSLLDSLENAPLVAGNLSFRRRGPQRKPLYLIDLNVVFDLAKRRPNALGAGRMFAAAMENSLLLGISSEFISELERNWDGGIDPILEMSRALPQFRVPQTTELRNLRAVLGPILFSERWKNARLTIQDESDIRHLATVIVERADGFVTSEKALLTASDTLQERYGISVVSPAVIGKSTEAPDRNSTAYRIETGALHVAIEDVSQPIPEPVFEFLRRTGIAASVIRDAPASGATGKPRRHLVARTEEGICAFASWSATSGKVQETRLYLFVDESNDRIELILERLLDVAARDAAKSGPTIIEMNVPFDQRKTRNVARQLGFQPSVGEGARSGKIEKLCLGGVVTPAKWTLIRSNVSELVGLQFPSHIPSGLDPSELQVLVTSGSSEIEASLLTMEDAFAPALIVGKQRACAITPIKPRYAEALFQGSRQPTFLEQPQGAASRQKRFFGDAKTYGAIEDGGLIFFYESQDSGRGRGAAIAVARVLRRYLAPQETVDALSQERGVLGKSELAMITKHKQACVTEFDQLFLFERPIPLAQLKEIGCADNSNLVTARSIATEAGLRLIELGQPNA